MLFLKECKKVFFSLTFFLYCAALIAMYFTQFDGDNGEPLEKPIEGADYYGMVSREVPEILMPAATEGLVREYLSGSYTAYPYGFIKNVRLKEKEKSRMAEIIGELTGLTGEELESYEEFPGDFPELEVSADLTYERFRELMREADDIIGGGSQYGDAYLLGFSRVPRTYEDALAEYEEFLQEDKITGAYARLYCDYMGIVLGILPVFVAVSLMGLDAKLRMEQLAYSRQISSAKLVFNRFLALTVIQFIPVVITAVHAHVKVIGLYPSYNLDHLAIYRYAFFWLLPNIMTATAVGMLLTEAASGFLGIFIQGAWWFASIMAATEGLTGQIGRFTLVMRHNNLLGYGVFQAEWGNVVFNRIFYTLMSILAVALTALVYEQKRRGRFYGLSGFGKSDRRQSKA